MINRRKQRIVSIVVVATLVPSMVAFLIYLFATGSPDALPLLVNAVGALSGFVLVYFVDYALRTSLSAGRWIRGVVLAGVCVSGFVVQAALPFDSTSSGAFAKGLGFGAGMLAFLTLLFEMLLPMENSMREGR